MSGSPRARAPIGHRAAFAELVREHWRELHIHCYRMLGSFDEAEDLVQETFLRAWRAREGFDGSPHPRAWLYRIATNACLDVLRKRPKPSSLRSLADIPWLQPYPDRLLDEAAPREDEPDAVAVTREAIELAYLAAIQLLPPRQRAVLIVREVLGWSATETAALLDMSVAATNSALQRARATVREHRPEAAGAGSAAGLTTSDRELLDRYVRAHGNADPEALASLLRDDVRATMPPQPMCYVGRDALAPLFARAFVSGEFGEWLLLPTAANRMPAAASYHRAPRDSDFRPCKIDVLRVEGGRIAEITSFGPGMFPLFGLRDRP